MKHKRWIIGSLTASLALSTHGQGTGVGAGAGSDGSETNAQRSVANRAGRVTNKSGVVTNQSGGVTELALVSTVPDTVVWQFGAPTSRSNKFNPKLPNNLPPPAADQQGVTTNPPGRGTNLATTAAKLQPASGSNGVSAVLPETVIWQFGAPTSRSNKFNPVLPTTLPPPATE